MSSAEIANQLANAQILYENALRAGYVHGCLETSLVALGGNLTVEQLDKTCRQPKTLTDAIENLGLRVNWIVTANKEVDEEDIILLFGGYIELEESYPKGELAGYLFIEHGDGPSHAVAIIVDALESYVVMDTSAGGKRKATASQLACLVNQTMARGSIEIAQIKKVDTHLFSSNI